MSHNRLGMGILSNFHIHISTHIKLLSNTCKRKVAANHLRTVAPFVELASSSEGGWPTPAHLTRKLGCKPNLYYTYKHEVHKFIAFAKQLTWHFALLQVHELDKKAWDSVEVVDIDIADRKQVNPKVKTKKKKCAFWN